MASSKNIVVWGECGDGKSTLINKLTGTDAAVTGREPDGVTKEVKPYEGFVCNGTPVKLWDLPGAGDIDIKPYMVLQALAQVFGVEKGKEKIDGLLILTKDPTRVKLGAQTVMQLMSLSFSNANKWENVALVGTMKDKYEQDDEHRLKTKTLETFNKTVDGKISKVVCISKDDIAGLVPLIESMSGMGEFILPEPEKIAQVVCSVNGVKPEDMPAQIEKIVQELRENNARLEKSLRDATAKMNHSSGEKFKGIHLGPLGRFGFTFG